MKKIDLDFTSLLDIMLILLFVFILNTNAENIEKEKENQAEMNKKNVKISELQTKIQELKAESTQQQAELEALQKQLAKFSANSKQSSQTWHNYQVLSSKFHIINITIRSPHNQLEINEKSYPLYITTEDALTQERRLEKQKAIQDILEKEIDTNSNGYPYVLLSAGKDLKIPRLAYTILWQAVKATESKYGTDKVFKTEFYNSK